MARHYETKVTNIIPRCPLLSPLGLLVLSGPSGFIRPFGSLRSPLVSPAWSFLVLYTAPSGLPPLGPFWSFIRPHLDCPCLVPFLSGPLGFPMRYLYWLLFLSGSIRFPLHCLLCFFSVSSAWSFLARNHRHKQSLLQSISRLLHVPSI